MDSEPFIIAPSFYVNGFLVFFVGTFFGSFFYCLAYRFSRKEDWMLSRSRCPSCGHELNGFDLLPLFSYCLFKGRCRYCKERISFFYPLSELCCGILFLAIFIKDQSVSMKLFSDLIIYSLLYLLSLIDLFTFTLPDPILLIGVINRFVQRLLQGSIFLFIKDLAGAFCLSGGLYVIVLIMNLLLNITL